MSKLIRVLDLYCGIGGASSGIVQAFISNQGNDRLDVTGVDIEDQPDYQYGFLKQNVLDMPLSVTSCFDFIWASPPTEPFVDLPEDWDIKKDKHMARLYALLLNADVPFVIEDAHLKRGTESLFLCGTMLGLKTPRHKYFKIEGFTCRQPEHSECSVIKNPTDYLTITLNAAEDIIDILPWQEEIGINWSKNKVALAQAMPPAYSKYIFTEFLKCQTKNPS